MNNSRLKTGDIVRHFKGGTYEILCIAKHTEDNIDLVIYKNIYAPDKIWARPIEMFMGKVNKTKYPDATQEYRFEKIKNKENDYR